MTRDEFVDTVVAEAQQQGYTVSSCRNGRQINFGHKKLHEGHLRSLYPAILGDAVSVSTLIDAVAPGRPCSHRPMREILAVVKNKL